MYVESIVLHCTTDAWLEQLLPGFQRAAPLLARVVASGAQVGEDDDSTFIRGHREDTVMQLSMIWLRTRVRDRKVRDRLAFALAALGACTVVSVATPEPIGAEHRTPRDTVAIAANGLRVLRPDFWFWWK